MQDPTELARRVMVSEINASVASEDELLERKRLEVQYGQVWNTVQLGEDFEVIGFLAPFCVVRFKKTNQKGSVMFQHYPRFYFDFQPDRGEEK